MLNPDDIQWYKIHQESIILDLFSESDICDNYSYASCVDWEIEKTPGANPKKLEFNIDKSETNLIKIDFNINVNDNEINDMHNKASVHPSYDLTNDVSSNIEDHKDQHKQTNGNNIFTLLLITKYNQAPARRFK